MSRLKPGADYIYEHADGITYAREVGAPISSRFEIGRSMSRIDLDEHNEWIKIRVEAKTNPALQEALDRAKIIYQLSKDE